MLDRLASSGVRIDDTPFIEFAQAGMREICDILERPWRPGEIDPSRRVFDTHYVAMPGTNPVQYETRFCAFADAMGPARSSTG
jgi:methyl-accepting chemotaxis protein